MNQNLCIPIVIRGIAPPTQFDGDNEKVEKNRELYYPIYPFPHRPLTIFRGAPSIAPESWARDKNSLAGSIIEGSV